MLGADLPRGDSRDLTPDQRVTLFAEMLELIPRHGAHLWVRGIHKKRHAERAVGRYSPDHPYKLGFTYLLEAIDDWLQEQQPSPDRLAAGEKPVLGVLVSDEQDEVSRDLVSGFARWRQFGTDHGYRTRDIKYLIDTIHYVKSQDSWIIQLIDCVALVRNRLEKTHARAGYDLGKLSRSDRISGCTVSGSTSSRACSH